MSEEIIICQNCGENLDTNIFECKECSNQICDFSNHYGMII